MKKPIIFTVLFLLSSVFVYAQGNGNTKPDSTIKIIPDGRHYLYTVDGKLISPMAGEANDTELSPGS